MDVLGPLQRALAQMARHGRRRWALCDRVAPHCIRTKNIRPSTRPIALELNSPLETRRAATSCSAAGGAPSHHEALLPQRTYGLTLSPRYSIAALVPPLPWGISSALSPTS